ncbi:YqaA family protein [Ferrimonas lipolytica]|uniref:DedA family protein n=1 Tax=Ferrimonas lipolytica TaxID=2724191 RepID=A0A6H1U957_9GAMM|nr:YqaA family protein [Ferrimonas lipolytica]QIZ75577.1 DedA family protein [Ferrimonas lipolytica]
MSYTFTGLFVAAFVSASLAPGGSEAALIYLLQQSPHQIATLVAIATIGNTLGSLTSYALGRWVHRSKPPEKLLKGKENKALSIVQRYGQWSLLLAWLPLIGDALPLLAGWFRFNLLSSTLLILLGKLLRYLVLSALTLGVLQQL